MSYVLNPHKFVYFSPAEVAGNVKICYIPQVSQKDGLPQTICNECLTKLDDFYQFREVCRKTDNAFSVICSSESTKSDSDLSNSKSSEKERGGKCGPQGQAAWFLLSVFPSQLWEMPYYVLTKPATGTQRLFGVAVLFLTHSVSAFIVFCWCLAAHYLMMYRGLNV